MRGNGGVETQVDCRGGLASEWAGRQAAGDVEDGINGVLEADWLQGGAAPRVPPRRMGLFQTAQRSL